MSSIMKGLENESNDFSQTIKNITAQNPKGSAATKMVLGHMLRSPMYDEDAEGEDWVMNAVEWLQTVKSNIAKKFPELQSQLNDLHSFAMDMYEDWLASKGRLEEDDVKEDTAYAGGMGQGGRSGTTYHNYKAVPAGLKENLLNTYAAQFGFTKEGVNDKLDMDQEQIIKDIWGPASKDLRNRRYIVHAPKMKISLSVDKPDEAIKIAQLLAKRDLNSPVSVIDRTTKFPIAQYKGSEDVSIQKTSGIHEGMTTADVKKELDEAHKAVFAILKNIWTKGNKEPKNDEEFLGMAERYAKVVLFADIDEATKQRAAESLATDLIPLWHDYHWNKTGFKEGYSAGAVGGAGLGEIASRNNPTGTGWRHPKIGPAGLKETDDTDLKQIQPDTHNDDKEGEFTKNQIQTMLRVLKHMKNAIADDDDLPEWIQKNITVAQDKIVSAMDYLISDKETEMSKSTGTDVTINETIGPNVIRLGKPKKASVELSNGKFDQVTEYPIFRNKSHVGMLTFSKFFGELYGDMGGKAIPTMSIKFDASDPMTANAFFQKWLKSPEGQRRINSMSNTKMRTKVMPDDEPFESAVMKGIHREDVKKVTPAAPVLPIQQTQTNPKQEPYLAPDKKTPAAIIDIKKTQEAAELEKPKRKFVSMIYVKGKPIVKMSDHKEVKDIFKFMVEKNPDLDIQLVQKFVDLDESIEPKYAAIFETWSKKYKKSIDCNNPKGFSQKAHCAGRKARQAGKHTKSEPINEYNIKPETFKDEYGKQRGIADLYQRMLEILKDPENTRKVQQIINDFNTYYTKINKKPIAFTLKQFKEYARSNPAMEGYWNQIIIPNL